MPGLRQGIAYCSQELSHFALRRKWLGRVARQVLVPPLRSKGPDGSRSYWRSQLFRQPYEREHGSCRFVDERGFLIAGSYCFSL
jgi:hypothetical protein